MDTNYLSISLWTASPQRPRLIGPTFTLHAASKICIKWLMRFDWKLLINGTVSLGLKKSCSRVLGGSLRRMQSRGWKRDGNTPAESFPPFNPVQACELFEKRHVGRDGGGRHFLTRYLSLSSGYIYDINTVTNSSPWVLLCVNFLGIHLRLMLKNVLGRWRCERVPLWIIHTAVRWTQRGSQTANHTGTAHFIWRLVVEKIVVRQYKMSCLCSFQCKAAR